MAYETKVQDFKVSAVDALTKEFEGKTDFIFSDYRGLTVAEITELRSKLREEKGTFKVIKNRYAKIAFEKTNVSETSQWLVGPTAVAYGESDASALAKILFEYQKNTPLEVKGGILEGNAFDAKQVEAFAKLPSRDVLLAQIMGTMLAPVQNMVSLLNGIPSKFVRTLQAVADKQK